MEIRLYPEKTAEGIRQAIEKAMDQNRRKQVFHAVGNAETGALAVAPESEYIEGAGDAWRGVCGLRRCYWSTVPGYAERSVAYLLAIIQGEKTARL